MAQTREKEGSNIRHLREYLASEEGIATDDFTTILEDAKQVFQRCVVVGARKQAIGLIYGHIQSGKTAVIITTMALAADSGYQNFIVLTTNLNDLYLQTLRRIEKSLQRFEVVPKALISRDQQETRVAPVAIVASKGSTVLNQVLNFVRTHKWQNQTVMIIDDEADQASLDTNINSPSRPRSSSAIHQKIMDLRNEFSSVSYLQTTATPGALLLQDSATQFRPNFVVQTHPGKGYVGGKVFFTSDDFSNSTYIRTVTPLDVQKLRTSNDLPDTVKRSLLTFFMGAAILRLGGNLKNYAYLMHTSFRKTDHRFATGLVESYFSSILQELAIGERVGLTSMDAKFRRDLRLVFRDLTHTFKKHPTSSRVIQEMASAIRSTRVAEINSQTGAGIDPDPTRRHTVYIGGMKIGRGVTINNLLVTYYGRDASAPQLDTVLQHARMYGYRLKELPAIRVFLPLHLATRFRMIHRIDDDMRHLADRTHEVIPLIPFTAGSIRPTRRVVLNRRTVSLNTYLAGTKYFPANPISSVRELGSQTTILDELLSQNEYPQRQHPYRVTVEKLLELLSFRFGRAGSGSWEDTLIRASIETLRDIGKLSDGADLVIVNRGSRLSKNRDATVGAVLPGNPPGAPYRARTKAPALYMTRVTGLSLGWDGVPFWIPVLRFPDGNYAFGANIS